MVSSPTFSHASTTDGLSFFAGVDTSFDGVFVPEPATWAMMLAGFGGLGLVASRRRTKGLI
jgi:hypothetical protein